MIFPQEGFYHDGYQQPAGAGRCPSFPDFRLTVNAKDVTANLRDRLLSLTLTDNRGFEADQLDIELDDADGQLALPVRGAVVKLFRLGGPAAHRERRVYRG